ncbi:MAG: signal peptidase I [Minisyncoccia bacterium]
MKALREIAILVFLAVLIVLPIRAFVAQPFIVEGESMVPTFSDSDYLIIDEFTYRLEDPKRGDVIVFRYPGNPSIFYIKRIIGLPGETVRIKEGVVEITGADSQVISLSEPYVINEDATYAPETTLGKEHYFVMGDNRPRSSDSRVWGPLPREDIMGRALLRVFPTAHAGFFPGKTEYAP